jgi:hypothetical protein
METIAIHMDKIQGQLKFENFTFNKCMEKKWQQIGRNKLLQNQSLQGRQACYWVVPLGTSHLDFLGPIKLWKIIRNI